MATFGDIDFYYWRLVLKSNLQDWMSLCPSFPLISHSATVSLSASQILLMTALVVKSHGASRVKLGERKRVL